MNAAEVELPPVIPPPPPPAALPRLDLHPSFFGAFRALWLFTWKTRITWRRLPLAVAVLLALPLLIYLTTSSPESWAQRHTLFGNAANHVNELARRLGRTASPLRPDQQAQLVSIFQDEYNRTETQPGDFQLTAADREHELDQVRDCYQRISNRARDILDERQMSSLTALERRKTAEAERRLSLPMWTRTGPFYHWLIDFYFFVMLPLACVGACGPLIREELQADTLGFLLTRPVTRARLVLAKHLALTAWLQIVVIVEALLLFLAGGLREVPSLFALLPLFLGAQFLAVLAWSALGTLLGLISKKYMALALIYGLIVEMGIGRIPTNINTLSLMRHLKSLLAHNPALQSMYEWTASGVPLAIIALLFAPVLFLALSAVMFTLAEYHHNAEMQK